MFRAQTFPSMGKQQCQSAQALPLGLPAGDEKIDNPLGIVCKIPELRFPKHQCFWLCYGIAIFETQNTRFRQKRVVNHEGRLFFIQMIQGNVGLTAFGIEQNRMPLTEGTPAHILSAQADGKPFHEQRCKCQCLGTCPVNAFTRFYSGQAFSQ